jgi:hypothetical protein
MKRPELTAAGSGLAMVLFGVTLLLQEEGRIELTPGWLLAALAACTGLALVASGLGARDRRRP